MFFFSFLCCGIPDLALGILKMLIRVCFRDVLQLAVYEFVPGMIWLSANLYRKCSYSIHSKSLLFTSISYVQESFKLNEVNHEWKCCSVLVVFLWPIVLFDFSWYK